MESFSGQSPVTLGENIPSDLIAPLRDSSGVKDDGAEIRKRMAQDGYIYLPHFFVHDEVMAARRDVFTQLATVGEINEPVLDGIYSGTSQRRERCKDLGTFWRTVSETWTLRRLSHGPQLHRLMADIMNEPSRVQDYIFLRPAGPGKFTNVHCDAPFFTRTTEQVNTAWIALGDVPVSMGPLFIVENSHTFDDLTEQFRGYDYSPDDNRAASISGSPVTLAKERQTRLLTTDFKAGDVLVFGMYLFHGALDNVSTGNQVRLSCDVRYQAAAAPLDSRYFGPDPSGTTGASYGELVGAKPMTEAWHQR